MPGWKTQIRTHGVVSSRSVSNASADTKRSYYRGRYNANVKKENADICLNCTKKNCGGTKGCFAKRKKEAECEKDGNSSDR